MKRILSVLCISVLLVMLLSVPAFAKAKESSGGLPFAMPKIDKFDVSGNESEENTENYWIFESLYTSAGYLYNEEMKALYDEMVKQLPATFFEAIDTSIQSVYAALPEGYSTMSEEDQKAAVLAFKAEEELTLGEGVTISVKVTTAENMLAQVTFASLSYNEEDGFVPFPYGDESTVSTVVKTYFIEMINTAYNTSLTVDVTEESFAAVLADMLLKYGLFVPTTYDYTLELAKYDKDSVDFFFTVDPEWVDIDTLEIKVNGKAVAFVDTGKIALDGCSLMKFTVPVVAGENALVLSVTSADAYDPDVPMSATYNIVANVTKTKTTTTPPPTSAVTTTAVATTNNTLFPPTGDNNTSVLLASLVVFSLVFGSVIYRKKSKK